MYLKLKFRCGVMPPAPCYKNPYVKDEWRLIFLAIKVWNVQVLFDQFSKRFCTFVRYNSMNISCISKLAWAYKNVYTHTHTWNNLIFQTYISFVLIYCVLRFWFHVGITFSQVVESVAGRIFPTRSHWKFCYNEFDCDSCSFEFCDNFGWQKYAKKGFDSFWYIWRHFMINK